MMLFCGGYTPDGKGGIYTLNFNESNGEIVQKALHKVINPSYLCLSKDQKLLYTFEEIAEKDKPKLKAFSIEEDGKLDLVNEQIIPGSYPCHLTLSPNGKFLLVACYGTGNVQSYPIGSDGSIGEMADKAQHNGKSENIKRQEGPHAHMVSFDDAGKLYVCDLGIDKVMVYGLNEAGKLKLLENEVINLAAGSGPRHMVFHPSGKYAFVLNELTSTVSLLEKQAGKFVVKKDYLSLDGAFSGLPSAAAIRISKDGKQVFTSDRTINAISIFEFDVDTGTLELKRVNPCKGTTPRDFNISPSGKWLLSAHQNSNDIVVFKLSATKGKMKEQSKIVDIESPTSLVFLGK